MTTLVTGGRGGIGGVVYGTRELGSRLIPCGGSIVAIASLAGLPPLPLGPAYTATMHAVVGWVPAHFPGVPGPR